jgi:hypothetical protein
MTVSSRVRSCRRRPPLHTVSPPPPPSPFSPPAAQFIPPAVPLCTWARAACWCRSRATAGCPGGCQAARAWTCAARRWAGAGGCGAGCPPPPPPRPSPQPAAGMVGGWGWGGWGGVGRRTLHRTGAPTPALDRQLAPRTKPALAPFAGWGRPSTSPMRPHAPHPTSPTFFSASTALSRSASPGDCCLACCAPVSAACQRSASSWLSALTRSARSGNRICVHRGGRRRSRAPPLEAAPLPPPPHVSETRICAPKKRNPLRRTSSLVPSLRFSERSSWIANTSMSLVCSCSALASLAYVRVSAVSSNHRRWYLEPCVGARWPQWTGGEVGSPALDRPSPLRTSSVFLLSRFFFSRYPSRSGPGAMLRVAVPPGPPVQLALSGTRTPAGRSDHPTAVSCPWAHASCPFNAGLGANRLPVPNRTRFM